MLVGGGASPFSSVPSSASSVTRGSEGGVPVVVNTSCVISFYTWAQFPVAHLFNGLRRKKQIYIFEFSVTHY